MPQPEIEITIPDEPNVSVTIYDDLAAEVSVATITLEGPPGPAGPPGAGDFTDPGDLTLVFNNQLV